MKINVEINTVYGDVNPRGLWSTTNNDDSTVIKTHPLCCPQETSNFDSTSHLSSRPVLGVQVLHWYPATVYKNNISEKDDMIYKYSKINISIL
jgi:hypothetical protein